MDEVINGLVYLNSVRRRGSSDAASSHYSTISARSMELIIDRLKMKQVRETTSKNYMGIWRHFNKFLIKLDNKPPEWEQRTALFCAYLIDKGNKSATLKSYISAIKMVLKEDGYSWDDNKILFNSLTRACKLENDTVKCRFPIQRKLLELILFEIQRIFADQQYLQLLYEALFM